MGAPPWRPGTRCCPAATFAPSLTGPFPGDDLARVLEAGRRSASSANQQRRDFVAVTDKTRLVDLATVWRGARHVAGSAATIALVAPDVADPRTREPIQYDPGQATMAMLIAATDLGIGSCHAALAAQDLAPQLLGLPADRLYAWLIALGYPWIARYPPCAARTGGRSNRWFTAIGGDRQDHVVATRSRRSPIRARGGDGRTGSPLT